MTIYLNQGVQSTVRYTLKLSDGLSCVDVDAWVAQASIEEFLDFMSQSQEIQDLIGRGYRVLEWNREEFGWF